MKSKILLLAAIVSYTHGVIEWEIVIPTYNNEKWCIQNIESVVQQTYPHWHATVVVDCATDATERLLREYIQQHNLGHKIRLMVNKTRRGALANIYTAVWACPGSKIIGVLDGDDWFSSDQVLEKITQVYRTQDVWLTYGNFRFWPENRDGWCRDYDYDVIKKNSFRSVPGVLPSHFRTFYAWLFKRIKLKDLLCEGKFYPMAWDLAMMFPMIEMASERHRCIKEIMYIYNIANPLNDFNVNIALQSALAGEIRSKKPYRRLPERPVA